MKKFLGLFLVVAVLTACNNSAESTDNAKDSLDSIANLKKDVVDSSADARKNAIDSVTNAKKESLDKLDSLNKKDTTRK
ncbi:MAG TPA: hypothetical protein VNR87_14270 [Flavisolibacter sp.]|nr:hypothetical protein [Flavisolibacter sp.]